MYIQPTLLDSLKVQYRVIRALMLRQILLRWGRNNLGYLWLFLEPLILIAFIVGFVSFANANGFEKVHHHITIVPFLFFGVSQGWAWRFVSQKCADAFSGNIPLLEHRYIRPLDLFIASAVVELLGVSVAFLGVYIGLYMFGFIGLPDNLPMMIFTWWLIVWFSLAYGVSLGAISGAFEFVGFAMRGINILFYVASGVVFSIAWLPSEYREIVLWLPMIHGTEMLRHSYFGENIESFGSPVYLMGWNIGLTFLALYIGSASWLEDIRE